MGQTNINGQSVSDAEVIARSAVDPAVFGQLFERYHGDVYGYLTRRIGSDRADDLASQTFVIAFERRHTFKPDAGQVRAWLFGIATHLVWNDFRAEQRLLRAIVRMQGQTVSDCGVSGVERWQVDGALAAALLALDGDQRDVLLLTAWGELSNDEVAAALSIPVGTVRSRLSRARAQLRAKLGSISASRALDRAFNQRSSDDG